MHTIEFPESVPSYCSAGPSLQCIARVDGHPATYEVTAEALEDHFGAQSYLYDDLVAAYVNHRSAIEKAAREVFDMTGAHSIALHSGHFRYGL